MKQRRRRGYPVRRLRPQRIVVRIPPTYFTAAEVRALMVACQQNMAATQAWLGRGL